MEIMCATLAYGLTSARVHLRRVVKTLSKARAHISSFSAPARGRRRNTANPLDSEISEMGLNDAGGLILPKESKVEVKQCAV
jgi:hypothetical protein